jgi:hypothetical protein
MDLQFVFFQHPAQGSAQVITPPAVDNEIINTYVKAYTDQILERFRNRDLRSSRLCFPRSSMHPFAPDRSQRTRQNVHDSEAYKTGPR